MNTKVKIELESQQAYNSVKDLQKALKATKDEMVGLEAGSEAFLEAAKKAGELKHQIDEINQSVRGASSDFGDIIGNISTVGAGITGSFQAASAALSAFGVDSEEVTESIKKMQNIMAMTQGLAAIDAQIKALKKLGTTITSTTRTAKLLKTALQPKVFLAITVAIEALLLIWNKWGDSIKESIPFIDGLSKALQKFKGDADEAAKSARDYDAEIEAIGGSSEKLTKQSKISKLNKEASKQYKELEEQAKLYRVQLLELEKSYKEHNITWKEYNEKGRELLDLEKQSKDAQDAILANEDSYIDKTSQLAEERKKLVDQYERERIVRSVLENLGKKDEITAPTPVTVEDESVEDDPEEKKILARGQALLNYYQLVADKYKEQELSDEEYYANAQLALDKALELKLISQEEYATAVKNLNKEIAESEAQQLEETIHNASKVAEAAGNLLSDVFNDIADAQNANNKEGFEQQKKLQIAAATIQMLTGIATAFTGAYTTKSGPWDFALMGIQAATIAAAGAANINKIKQQKFDGASSGAAVGSLAKTAVIAPVQYTQDIQGAEITSAIKDTRVYVTESDITNTQHKVNVAESESRF